MIKKGCVSVIIPVYNRENMIGDAIESVLSQSYSNLELIVVNNASTDNTGDVIESFDDDRILSIETSSNEGAYVARNIGIKRASGEYVAFLDSDDVWLPEKLQKQMTVVKKTHRDFVFTNGFFLRESETEYQMGLLLNADNDIYRGKCHTELLRGNFIASSSVMLKRSIIDDIGYFIAENRGALDYEMWLRVTRKYEIDFIPQPLFLYNSHPSNLSRDREARLRDALYVYELDEKWSAKNGLKNDKKVARGSISRIFLQFGLFYYGTRRSRTARKYLFRALTSSDIDLYSRIWSLACVVTPYPIYQRLYKRYVELRMDLMRALSGKITPIGAIKYVLLSFLYRISLPSRKSLPG